MRPKTLIFWLYSLSKMGAIAVLCMSPAVAIPYQGKKVYRVTNNGVTSVYISGTANQRISVDLGRVPRTQARMVGRCGELRISPSVNRSLDGLKVDGVPIDVRKLPVQTLPTCKDGSFVQTRTKNFITPSGQVILVGRALGKAVAVTLNGPEVRNVTINACGFGVLRPRSGKTLPTSFKIGDTAYTLGSLLNAQEGPVCRKSQGRSRAYIPASWR